MNLSRIVSMLIYLVYVAAAITSKAPIFAVYPLPGLAFIWFPSLAKFFDQLGVYTRGTAMDPNTPSCVFVVIGWAMLFAPAAFILFVKLVDR